MIDINLLPWRFYAYRKKQQILFYLLLTGVGISFLILTLLNYTLQKKIDDKTVEINKLRLQLASVESQANRVKKYKQQMLQLCDAQKTFRQVEINQLSLLELFQGISTMTSPHVYLVDAKHNKGITIFKGVSHSSATLLPKINHTYFQPAQMLEIKNDPTLKQLQFEFQITQRYPFLWEKDDVREVSA